jgi:hypothetical protein
MNRGCHTSAHATANPQLQPPKQSKPTFVQSSNAKSDFGRSYHILISSSNQSMVINISMNFSLQAGVRGGGSRIVQMVMIIALRKVHDTMRTSKIYKVAEKAQTRALTGSRSNSHGLSYSIIDSGLVGGLSVIIISGPTAQTSPRRLCGHPADAMIDCHKPKAKVSPLLLPARPSVATALNGNA